MQTVLLMPAPALLATKHSHRVEGYAFVFRASTKLQPVFAYPVHRTVPHARNSQASAIVAFPLFQ